ncbi:EAL domain-containing protein [Roseicyclus sp. F158]|uniref:EAL domain-containing protein n=1 Tax=Tropicimonas omnivorans TaxID=3075590 RepID=A0ABU3DC07_9RHOB|nr:EAL domain-containing protein [Roseicyclus sp. F158]MDT0681195.1 EAL domain-containing protein [Roseicyclus sp. F158]
MGNGAETYVAAHDSSPLAAAIAQRDLGVLRMVETALARGDALLAFQPIVNAKRTGQIAFHEGLIRVMDETGRIIPARDFIGACETNRIGRQLDTEALRLGLRALNETPSLRLAINMSARSIGYRPWIRELERGLALDPTVAERLIIEITESSAMLMPDITTIFMQDLQQKGVCFALDDFGAGYTSFRYLRDFDFDIIKIAGEFIGGISTNPDNRVLAQALVGIAHHFEMFTVAEAVETEVDAKVLQEIGVDCMQGYYFGMPTTWPPQPGVPAMATLAG